MLPFCQQDRANRLESYELRGNNTASLITANNSVANAKTPVPRHQSTMLTSNHSRLYWTQPVKAREILPYGLTLCVQSHREWVSTVIDPQMGKTLARKLGPQYVFNK